ncbi:class I SAM-dependent methyltransferase [Candidatus Shapirobacteria bacterium]|nr:class I SAM-dependent methyltransferase [Candidatus Shapirobacteria bacterium]
MISWEKALNQVEKNLTSFKDKQYFQIHSARYAFVLNKISKINPNQSLKILDIGCFPDHLSQALKFLGHQIFGIASTHEPLKRKNVFLLNAEKDPFPFNNNFFDLILLNELIEHFPQSPLPVLKEALRVTKDKGFLVLTTPNAVRLINRLKIAVGQNTACSIDHFFQNKGQGGNLYHRHNREYNFAEVEFILKKTNWLVVEKSFFNGYPPYRKKDKAQALGIKALKWLYFLTTQAYPAFKDSLFFKTQKK